MDLKADFLSDETDLGMMEKMGWRESWMPEAAGCGGGKIDDDDDDDASLIMR